KDVVGRLRHVDVVVGIDSLVRPALAIADALCAQDLRRPIGQHLVGVHVVADAGTRLEWVNTEVVDELGLQGATSVGIGGSSQAKDFVGGLDYRVGEVLVEATCGGVGARGSL